MSPRILSLVAGSITNVNLNQLAFWRLEIGSSQMVTSSGETPAFTLFLRYPSMLAATFGTQVTATYPATVQVYQMSNPLITLARTAIPIAKELGELEQVTKVALEGGSRDLDAARTREAFNLFKNNVQIKGNAMESCIKDSIKIIDAYWDIRMWVENGFAESKKLEPAEHTTVLLENGLAVGSGSLHSVPHVPDDEGTSEDESDLADVESGDSD